MLRALRRRTKYNTISKQDVKNFFRYGNSPISRRMLA